MRVSNSLSDGEVDLLEQVCKGLMRGQRDLAHLARHPSFASLATKTQAMSARISGSPAPTTKPRDFARARVDEEVLAVVRKNPGCSSAEVTAALGTRSRAGVIDRLTVLAALGRIERRGASNMTRYWPKEAGNVVALDAAKPALPVRLVTRPAEGAVRS